MLKLHRQDGTRMRYWEAWSDDDGGFVVHHGMVGETGRTEHIGDGLFRMADDRLHRRIRKQRSAGFREIRESDHFVLSIVYSIEPGECNVVTRQRALEDRMNETLGWTGLGAADGGSVSKDTMEVTVLVVDAAIAEKVIADDLAGTEFAGYARIVNEGRAGGEEPDTNPGATIKYDDASWHSGADNFPKDSPPEYGGTHIALFMRWCFMQGWASELHREQHPDELRQVIDGSLSCTRYFFDCCDGKLTSEDFNDAGNAFAAEYYGDDGMYLNDCTVLFKDQIYTAPDSAHDFEQLDAVIRHRRKQGTLTYEQWQDAQRKPWWKFW